MIAGTAGVVRVLRLFAMATAMLAPLLLLLEGIAVVDIMKHSLWRRCRLCLPSSRHRSVSCHEGGHGPCGRSCGCCCYGHSTLCVGKHRGSCDARDAVVVAGESTGHRQTGQADKQQIHRSRPQEKSQRQSRDLEGYQHPYVKVLLWEFMRESQ